MLMCICIQWIQCTVTRYTVKIIFRNIEVLLRVLDECKKDWYPRIFWSEIHDSQMCQVERIEMVYLLDIPFYRALQKHTHVHGYCDSQFLRSLEKLRALSHIWTIILNNTVIIFVQYRTYGAICISLNYS